MILFHKQMRRKNSVHSKVLFLPGANNLTFLADQNLLCPLDFKNRK
jgi:hypothetical protein